ncbi:MAG: metallophosphoesterase family protein, partial [Longimicrobiales bacterium]
MRYLILSDIHSNWEALQAVLAKAQDQYDQILNCGDLVGYGPDPNAVVEFCRDHSAAVIRGNHDKASIGLENLDWFNPVARTSAIWTNSALTEASKDYLRTLPQGPLPVDGCHIVHGSPVDEDEYLLSASDVETAASDLSTGLAFFGHTHLQAAFLVHRNGVMQLRWPNIELEPDSAYMINPGSVGQPRDGDPRAAYAIYEPEERLVT